MNRLEEALREAAAAAREEAETASTVFDRSRLNALANFLWAEANATRKAA